MEFSVIWNSVVNPSRDFLSGMSLMLLVVLFITGCEQWRQARRQRWIDRSHRTGGEIERKGDFVDGHNLRSAVMDALQEHDLTKKLKKKGKASE